MVAASLLPGDEVVSKAPSPGMAGSRGERRLGDRSDAETLYACIPRVVSPKFGKRTGAAVSALPGLLENAEVTPR